MTLPWLRSIIVLFILAIFLGTSHAQSIPLYIFSGDGLTVVVLQEDKDSGELFGELQLGNQTIPFAGEAEDEELIQGNFLINGTPQSFVAMLNDDGSKVTFITNGQTFKLAKTDQLPSAPTIAKAPKKRSASAPIPMAEEQQTSPVNRPNNEAPIALKRVEFRDITMGNVVSHTMIIPQDWQAEGFIEWSMGDNVYPQPKLRVIGPDQSRITYVPAMTWTYTAMKPVAGFSTMPPQGTAPPANLGEWVISFAKQNNKAISNVQLVSDKRLPEAEATYAKVQRDLGANTQGTSSQIHLITLAYERDGVPMLEEMNATYARYAPIDNRNIHSQTWSLFVNTIITAPAEKFETVKSQLYAYAGTFLSVPKWWNQMMQARGEIMRVRADQINETIRQRGRMYDQISDQQYASWKKQNSSSDEAQRQRVQGIYEVSDFKDRDGSTVELPFHYNHVFSDGQGNYLLSNSYNDKPGAAFEEIKSAR